MTKSRSYKEDLLKALTDPIEAQEYLNAALEDEDPKVFLLALKDVVEATEDKTLEQIWFAKNNSQLNNIRVILNNLGFKLAIEQNAS